MDLKTKDVEEAIRALVQSGGVYSVDNKGNVLRSDGEVVTLGTGDKGKEYPLRVFKEGMSTNNIFVLNPIGGGLGENVQISTFWKQREAVLAYLFRQALSIIVEINTSDDDDVALDAAGIASRYQGYADTKTLTELKQIRPSRCLRLFYTPKERIAQAQTELFDNEWRARMRKGSKIRKKTFDFIDAFWGDVFGCVEDFSKEYQIKATQIGYPQTEALIKLYTMLAEKLDELKPLFDDCDLMVPKLIWIRDHLDELHKLSKWFVSSSAAADRKSSKSKSDLPPWEQDDQELIPGQADIDIPQSQGVQNNIPTNVSTPADRVVEGPSHQQFNPVSHDEPKPPQQQNSNVHGGVPLPDGTYVQPEVMPAGAMGGMGMGMQQPMNSMGLPMGHGPGGGNMMSGGFSGGQQWGMNGGNQQFGPVQNGQFGGGQFGPSPMNPVTPRFY